MIEWNNNIPTFEPEDYLVDTVGECKIYSPLDEVEGECNFVEDKARVVANLYVDDAERHCSAGQAPPSFEVAGPRRRIYFDPSKTKAAIVTCGGLCPGINSVIRSIVMVLYHIYGVRNILGIPFGLQGFIPKYRHPTVELGPEQVRNSHGRGGSLLGMSRGPQDIGEIVDALERLNIGILFTIGGDGTLRAGQKIAAEVALRGLKTAVIGIPKTIDNDISFVAKTFGFDTAVEAAANATLAAHNEAISLPNGVGLVKVMGRHAGHVACYATLAQADVNFCLIPEIPFELDGETGLLAKLEERLARRGHCVVLAAEGAGQSLFTDATEERDPSGNIKLHDIGIYLKERIVEHFSKKGIEVNLKYIDPSYMIRGIPASPVDRVFCGYLGQHAVHAGMAGKTSMMVSLWNNAYVHVPFSICTSRQKLVDPKGQLWRSVMEATGQGSLVCRF